MHKTGGAALALLLVTAVTSPGLAQEEAKDDKKEASGSAAEPQVFAAIVRGFFVEAKVGGGFMVLNQSISDLGVDPFNPQVTGSESLGGGATVALSVGYDITDMIGLELLGGATLVSGTRATRVRDLAMIYGGLGVRLAFDLTDRLDLVLTPGGAYVQADNRVDESSGGMGVFVGVGIEYYAHVRHFSVGLELSAFMPVSPIRLFIALTPTLKYTF